MPKRLSPWILSRRTPRTGAFPRGSISSTGRAPLWLSALAAAALFCAGCSPKEAADQAPAVSVQVAAAENTSIEQHVSADAILFPRDQAALVPKISAPVKKFYVDRGSHVKAGQLLAELESRDLAGAFAENQGGFEEAQANYDTATQKARQDLTLATQQRDAAKKVYDSRVTLLQQGAVSARDVEDARISLTQAQNQLDLAQKQYDLRAAEGQLNAARGKAEGAAAQLSYARVVSPIDGVVTDRPLFEGETPAPGAPLLTVMNISEIVARAHIAQADATRLKIGDAATITTAGLDQPLKGRVTLVSPALDPGSTTVEVWVSATNPGEKLKPGSSARVSIVATTVSHAVVIPAAALLTASDGSTSVILLGAGNKPQKQGVKVGIRDGDDAQITDGLKPGDRVVTVGAYELDSEDPDVLAKTSIQVQAPPPAGGDDAP